MDDTRTTARPVNRDGRALALAELAIARRVITPRADGSLWAPAPA